MLWTLLIDVAALISFQQWAPFDGPPRNANLAMQCAGIVGLYIHLAGYFFSILIGVHSSFLTYFVMFVIAYVELILVALGIARCWTAIKRISPL
jgi:hypothetical protein